MVRLTIGLATVLSTVALHAACAQVSVEPRPVCKVESRAAVPSEVPAAPAAALIETPLNSVNITDAALTNRITVQSTNARRNPSGTVEVWARLVNCTDMPLQIEARTHFLDEGKAPAEPVSGWSRVHLAPRAYGVYAESSTNVFKVRYYYVEVREGR